VSSPVLPWRGHKSRPADRRSGDRASRHLHRHVRQSGRIYFKVNAAEPGTMIADLSITTPAQQSTTHISSVNFAAHYLDVIPQVAGVFLAGAWTPYG